ncbi:leucine rich repeat [Seminavis robusta]|uniref:Leucine rich repeat n=1 Tax=Seminavis robusta TaxID=568900 RepID=A0A9N8DQF0_9STRA|nr:leucine rich repeat [Seminavis robusta]|eukprot:Sro298_g111040.1 leucine rich repeat (590) ;mRNA; r:17374-19342
MGLSRKNKTIQPPPPAQVATNNAVPSRTGAKSSGKNWGEKERKRKWGTQHGAHPFLPMWQTSPQQSEPASGRIATKAGLSRKSVRAQNDTTNSTVQPVAISRKAGLSRRQHTTPPTMLTSRGDTEQLGTTTSTTEPDIVVIQEVVNFPLDHVDETQCQQYAGNSTIAHEDTGGLVNARLVSSARDLPQAIEVDPQRRLAKQQSQTTTVTSNGNHAPSPRHHPPQSPTGSTWNFLPAATKWTILNDTASAQALAHRWLLDDPNLETLPEARLQQRWQNAIGFTQTPIHDDEEGVSTPVLNPCDHKGDYTRLNLAGNNLNGTVPAEIGLLTSLVEIHLEDNQIWGSLPSQIGRLSKLGILSIQNNTMTQSLPTELGQLSLLSQLHLFDNEFQGEVPSEVGLLTYLTQLHLQRTQIGGQLPTELGNLVRLEEFWTWNTNFSGTLPSHMGQMVSLSSLAMHNGELRGTIPTEFGQLTNMDLMQIDGHFLSGSIPTEFGQLKKVRLLTFGSNSLSSTIPTELGLLSKALGVLRFFQNELTGSVPAELGQLSVLQRLELDGNKLTKSIPAQLGRLEYLVSCSWLTTNLQASSPGR